MTRLRGERGAFTPMVVVLVTGLFVFASFIANAEAVFDLRREVAQAAASAARAAAQASPESLVHGSPLDAAGAASRADEVLTAAGLTGSVAITGGDTVTVTATGVVRTPMPDPFGLDGKTVTEEATAVATRGVTSSVGGG